MQITRYYTKEGQSPYDGIAFSTLDIDIPHHDPSRRCCMTDIEVPERWSYIASETLITHFFRRNDVPRHVRAVEEPGVPQWLWRHEADRDALNVVPKAERFGSETSAKQLFHRLAGAWTYHGWKQGYFDTEADARAFYDEWCHMLANQIVMPHGPQWLNNGLHWAYGIAGASQGHVYVDHENNRLKRSFTSYEHPPLHDVYLPKVKDDLVNEGGIMDLWKNETRMFKFGAGTGSNFSAIRSEGEQLSSGGYSFGLMRFLQVGDKAAGAVRASNIPHRSCKMVSVDLDHPDITSFIRWRMDEEQKAAALYTGAQALRTHLIALMEATRHGSEQSRCNPSANPRLKRALKKARAAMIPEVYIQRVLDYAKQGYTEIDIPVFGLEEQSDIFASMSSYQTQLAVRVPDAFMKQLGTSESWHTSKRKDGSRAQALDSMGLWGEIAQSAWAVGAPSMQFSDTINRANGCAESEDIRASSTGGDTHFLDDTASIHASINLMRCMDAKEGFDAQAIEHISALSTIMLDISHAMAQYPSRTIAMRTHSTRPIGVGFHNLAASLMGQGLAYDSDQGRATAASIAALMTAACYHASALLARDLGPFADYQHNTSAMKQTVATYHHHATAEKHTLSSVTPVLNHTALNNTNLSDAIARLWDMAKHLGEEYGYRNAQVTTINESQVMARMLDAASIAVSPENSLVHYDVRPSAGIEKWSKSHLVTGLTALDYEQEEIERICSVLLGRRDLQETPHINRSVLLDRGFSEEVVQRVEGALTNVAHLSHAFDPWILGDVTCRKVLKLNHDQIHDASFDILRAMGFSQEEIDEANRYCCGDERLDVALFKDPSHADVFAIRGSSVAAKEHTVTSEAQLEMMAQIQPCITGGVAHHITVPFDTPIDQMAELFYRAWQKGLKSISLSRESAALMNAVLRHVDVEEVAEETAEEEERDVPNITVASSREKVETVAKVLAEEVVERKRGLPERRGGYTQKAMIGDQKIYLRTGEYRDGDLGEIFIDMPKEAVEVRSLANHFAMAISIALQHGVPLESFVESFLNIPSRPSGEVIGNEAIQSATSMVDYVFRELAISYLGREDLADWADESDANEDINMSFTQTDHFAQTPSLLQDNDVVPMQGEAFSDIDECLREINSLTQEMRNEYLSVYADKDKQSKDSKPERLSKKDTRVNDSIMEEFEE